MSDRETVLLHLVVRGRVQGVGFRYFTERTARRLGLSGWVRNRSDGSVEVLARVPAQARQAFLAALRQGPPAAHVESVEELAADDTTVPMDDPFRVRS